jgi:oligoribonuclease NrnB/cAMP/cGMP phosphodiesterase (DHH superfamily)
MPCKSEYLEPNAREIEATRVARLLIYVCEALSDSYEPSENVATNAVTAYPNVTFLDDHTKLLCGHLKALSEEQANKIIWDGRKREARELAEWWERHQELDKEREFKEVARKDEHFTNNLISYITTERQLAIKQKRPVDRKKLRAYLNTLSEYLP